tara:strand:+ start:4481 stop:4702 length:222 start_codon:yes stop_codon:yes gene_type:complete
MIIPVKCFTCGKVIADKYRFYQQEVRKNSANTQKVVYLTKDQAEKTNEGKILDKLGIKKACCRRHFLTHIDIE